MRLAKQVKLVEDKKDESYFSSESNIIVGKFAGE